jgi:hypothetical protein
MLNYLNLPMRIEITGPLKSGHAAYTRILIFAVRTSAVATAPVQDRTIHGQAADSHSTLSENEDGAVKSLRPAVVLPADQELSMVSPDFMNEYDVAGVPAFVRSIVENAG